MGGLASLKKTFGDSGRLQPPTFGNVEDLVDLRRFWNF